MKTAKDYERMRRKKADKRQALAFAPETAEIGRAVLSGPAFDGIHLVQIMKVNDARPVVDFMIDGVMRGIRTERGARAALTRMMVGGCNTGRRLHPEQKRSNR